MFWESYEVSSFEEFVGQLADIMPTTMRDDGLYWFRGQSNSDWDLEPSFLRSSSGLGLSAESAVGLEKEALKLFQSKAHLFVRSHLLEKVKTIPCWWALMQHHGAPTRLIAVHLSAFEPIGEVLGNSSPIVIPGFRNEVYKLRMPRKALSGHVCNSTVGLDVVTLRGSILRGSAGCG